MSRFKKTFKNYVDEFFIAQYKKGNRMFCFVQVMTITRRGRRERPTQATWSYGRSRLGTPSGVFNSEIQPHRRPSSLFASSFYSSTRPSFQTFYRYDIFYFITLRSDIRYFLNFRLFCTLVYNWMQKIIKKHFKYLTLRRVSGC